MTFPNQLSLLRIVLAPIFLILFLSDGLYHKEIAFAVFFIAVMTDWYDGVIARKYGMTSRLGIFLDPLADKVLTSCAFILFYFLSIIPLWMLLIIVFRDIFITLLRSYHEYQGRTLATSFLAKTKTFIQMAYIIIVLTILILVHLYPDFELLLYARNFLYSDMNYVLLLIITIITLYTGLQYLFDMNKSRNEVN